MLYHRVWNRPYFATMQGYLLSLLSEIWLFKFTFCTKKKLTRNFSTRREVIFIFYVLLATVAKFWEMAEKLRNMIDMV